MFQCKCPSRRHADGSDDEVTLLDCRECEWGPRPVANDVRPIILKHHLSPGDCLVMSAAIRSLHMAQPGKFLVGVDVTCPAFYEHSPDVCDRATLERHGAPEELEVHYPAINQCNQRAVHMMQAYCEFLEEKLGVKVPLGTNRPHVWLAKEEGEWLPQVQEVTGKETKYWTIVGGTKSDYTAKGWGHENYQRVVDLLRGRVVFVQVGRIEHLHRPLKGVIDLVGKTDDRQLVRLVHHADGVLCGVTLLHHLAAALEKPCVTVMGGREPVPWNCYPRCQLFHSVGTLPCCRDGGCWRSRVVKLGDGSTQDGSLCDSPVPLHEETVPRCMARISPEAVAAAVASYLP